MPLHLLGKKSWNVYNRDNVARVRADEAAAEVRKKEEQRRIDEADAESRLQVLRAVRGEKPEVKELSVTKDKDDTRRQRPSKKRRLDGEDESALDIRLAREVQKITTPKTTSSSSRPEVISLTDKHGHINLFPENNVDKAKANSEVAAETAKKQQDFEDQYTMRFANAAGKCVSSNNPWYNGPARHDLQSTSITDSRRRDREKVRMNADDPLAAIKKGVKQLREADKHREEWRAQRERDLGEVEEFARKHKHRRKRRRSDEGSLADFDLDEGYGKDPSGRRKREVSSGSHRQHHRDGFRSHRAPKSHS